MALAHSNSISRNGLVMYYDVGNIKSDKGPPIANKIAVITPTAGTGTGYSLVTSTETVNIPTVGIATVNNTTITNDYPAVSASCCFNIYSYGSGIAVSPSTLYTYAILYRTESGYTHPNYMYRYEYTSGDVYVTESGIHNDANRTALGNGWYWAWATFTTQPTTTKLTCYSFHYRWGVVPDKTTVAKVLITAGNYTGLHPSKWPAPTVTRAATASLSDLTGNTTSDVTNAVYDTSGKLSFAGAGYVIFPESSLLNNNTLTVECWVKPSATTQNGFWFEKGQVNTQYALFQEGTVFKLRMSVNGGSYDLSATSATYLSTSVYNHVVATYISGTGRRLYVNGIQIASDSTTGTIATNANGMSVGAYGGYNGSRGYQFSGNIDIVRVYNRAISSDEAMQNFNAQRGRFGV